MTRRSVLDCWQDYLSGLGLTTNTSSTFEMGEERVRIFSRVWIPTNKEELVKVLSKLYPESGGRFKKMKKKMLYAIWFRVNDMEG